MKPLFSPLLQVRIAGKIEEMATLNSFITESLFHKKRTITSLRKDSYLRIALGSRYISTLISMVRVFSKEGKSKEKCLATYKFLLDALPRYRKEN